MYRESTNTDVFTITLPKPVSTELDCLVEKNKSLQKKAKRKKGTEYLFANKSRAIRTIIENFLGLNNIDVTYINEMPKSSDYTIRKILLEHQHIAILGKTQHGKTSLVKTLIRRINVPVICFDRAHEYDTSNSNILHFCPSILRKQEKNNYYHIDSGSFLMEFDRYGADEASVSRCRGRLIEEIDRLNANFFNNFVIWLDATAKLNEIFLEVMLNILRDKLFTDINRKLKCVIIVEEAHHYKNSEALKTFVSEGLKYGVRIITTSQSVWKDGHNNEDNFIVSQSLPVIFKLPPSEIKKLAMLDDEKKQEISMLSPLRAIVVFNKNIESLKIKYSNKIH